MVTATTEVRMATRNSNGLERQSFDGFPGGIDPRYANLQTIMPGQFWHTQANTDY